MHGSVAGHVARIRSGARVLRYGSPMPDAAREIENLLHTYAERIDRGDLEGVAELFEHGRIAVSADAPPEHAIAGRDACFCERGREVLTARDDASVAGARLATVERQGFGLAGGDDLEMGVEVGQRRCGVGSLR